MTTAYTTRSSETTAAWTLDTTPNIEYADRSASADQLRAVNRDRLTDEFPGGDGSTFGDLIDAWENGDDTLSILLGITKVEHEAPAELQAVSFADGKPWKKDAATSSMAWDSLAEWRVSSTIPPSIESVHKLFTTMDTSEEAIMQREPMSFDADMAARMYTHIIQSLYAGNSKHMTEDGRLLENFPSKPESRLAGRVHEDAWRAISQLIADHCRYDRQHHTSHIAFVYDKAKKMWITDDLDDDTWSVGNERNQPRAFDAILRGLGWRRITTWTTGKRNSTTCYKCEAAWMNEPQQQPLTTGVLLKWLRAISGMSQATLGAASRIPATRIGEWEQAGGRDLSGASLSVCTRLADALHVSVDLLAHPEKI